MSPRISLALCATAALVGLTAGAGYARAQTDQPAASTGNGGLEEIVVTARRKEERVQSIPLAITAASGVDSTGKQAVADLFGLSPSSNSNQLALRVGLRKLF